jgi:hypothetical protein
VRLVTLVGGLATPVDVSREEQASTPTPPFALTRLKQAERAVLQAACTLGSEHAAGTAPYRRPRRAQSCEKSIATLKIWF